MALFSKLRTKQSSAYGKENTYRDKNYYREAIYDYERQLAKQPKCVDLLCRWIENYHELASIYAQEGKIESAQKCLLIPHRSMLYMAQEHKADDDQEQIALRALSLTLPPLMAFASIYPPCSSCMTSLKSQLDMIEKNTKTDH